MELDAAQPLYVGDFGSSTEAFGLQVPRFACGGGGSRPHFRSPGGPCLVWAETN